MTSDTNTDPEHQDKQTPAYPRLRIDWDLYGSMLEESDLSEAEQIEMIEALANIVFAFIDLTFGIHPTQLACGEGDELSTLIAETMVSSDISIETPESETLARRDLSAEFNSDSK